MTHDLTRRALIRAAAATAGAIGIAGLAGGTLPAQAAASGAPDSTEPVRDLIQRYLGAKASQFELQTLPPAASGLDQFQISGEAGHIVLAGTSRPALTGAFNWWLKYVAGGHISWDYNQLDLPAILPAPASPITGATPFRIRLQGNITWLGYTSAYWDWERWQQEIDYFAASSYTHVAMSIGHEIVYYHLLQDYGYTEAEARAWIPLPGHQPWWWMDNLYGANGPISVGLMQRRARLGRQIMDRMRELGISPVVPGFLGFVPVDFADRNPGVDVVAQGDWEGYERPSILNPVSSLFAQMAADFYGYQQQVFGAGGFAYFGDFFQEGGATGDIDVTAAAGATQAAMQQASPGALWQLQAWSGNPRQSLITGVDTSKVFVVDLQADADPQWTATDAFWGAPWTWGTISNSGGDLALYGRLPGINTGLPAALTATGRGDLSGVHLAPEGNDMNPVLADFIADMVWRDAPVDLTDWITAYATRRYGRSDAQATAAWQILLATAYGAQGNTGNVDTAPDSLFNAQPSLAANTANAYNATVIPYNPGQLVKACRNLLDASPALRSRATYRYDLLDVTRQTLDNASRTLLPQINAAYQAGDRTRFRSLADHWLDLMKLQDRLLHTDQRFMVGPWLDYAARSAATAAERQQLSYDARDLISAWGNQSAASAGLRDYANRSWQGMVGDFYHHRWSLYFDSLDTALQTGTAPAVIDWFTVDSTWAQQQNAYPLPPAGDTHTIASQVWHRLTTDPMYGQVTATASPTAVAAGATAVVTVTFSNANPVNDADDVVLGLTLPSGFTVTATSPTSAGTVATAGTATATFTVTVSADYQGSSAMDAIAAAGTASFRYAGVAGESAGYATLLVPSPVQPPNHTVTFTTSLFGQNGDTYAIYAGGADMWGGTNQFGTIYQPGVLAVGGSVVTEVTAQSDTGPWTRAGIVVRNDLTTNGSPGYMDLALTPSGVALSWDSNGDGLLDSLDVASYNSAPCYLKLTRDSATGYTGSYSTDGTTWITVASVTVPGGSASQDAGIFATAASSSMGLYRFSGFTIGSAS